MTADLAQVFADHVVTTTFEALSQDAVDGAKKSIVDTLGVMLAASGQEPAVRAVIDLVQDCGGRPECSVIGFGGRAPAVMAALANGALAHCLDFDDQTPWGQHSASSIVPAAFAIAERQGGVSGRRLISAVAIGQDLFNRTRQAVDWRKDWMFTTVMGVFCATASACHLLGLTREQTAHAFGIALMQCSGSSEVVNATGGDLRAVYAGFPAKGAVLASLLAQRGLTSVQPVFEGPHGVLNLYFGGRYDRARLLDGLGQRYTGGLTLYKRWPAVGTAHSHIHATLELMRLHRLRPEDIAELRVHVGDYHRLMCEPAERRRRPVTAADAKFSLPYLVAIAARRQDVGLADFGPEALADPQTHAMIDRIVTLPDASLDWTLDLPAGRVVLITHDGRAFERTGTHIPGSADNPMGWDELLRKFEDCAAASVAPMSPDRIAAIGQMARTLETLDDATGLLRA